MLDRVALTAYIVRNINVISVNRASVRSEVDRAKKVNEALRKNLIILVLAELVREQTRGEVDYFKSEKVLRMATFPKRCFLPPSRETLSFAANVCEVVPAGLGEMIGDYAALSVAVGDF